MLRLKIIKMSIVNHEEIDMNGHKPSHFTDNSLAKSPSTLTATVDPSLSNQAMEKWTRTLPDSWNGWVSYSLDALLSVPLRKLCLNSEGESKNKSFLF